MVSYLFRAIRPHFALQESQHTIVDNSDGTYTILYTQYQMTQGTVVTLGALYAELIDVIGLFLLEGHKEVLVGTGNIEFQVESGISN